MATKAVQKQAPASEVQIAALNANFTAITEALKENLGGGISEFDLTRIKIPAGGATTFILPTLEGEVETKTVDAVIVFKRDVRTYWAKPLGQGEKAPPDCVSSDALVGIGNPGGQCLACPLSRFGSQEGKAGQACRQGIQAFLLRGDSQIPEVFQIPPTSIKAARGYFLKLTGQGIPYYAVISRITLERAKNPQGIDYSEARFAFIRKLTAEETKGSVAFNRLMASLVNRMPVHESE